jgi:hypothetical protein
VTVEEQGLLIDAIEGYFILCDIEYTKAKFEEELENKYDSYISVETSELDIIIEYDNTPLQKKYRCINFNISNTTSAISDTAYTYTYAYRFILNNLYIIDTESHFIKIK